MEQNIATLIEMNAAYSNIFLREKPRRERYEKDHPTKVVVFQCMDGRINFPLITDVPLGFFIQFRNIGGKFDMGWFGLSENFRRIREAAAAAGQKVLVLVTYHYSAGDLHRGCAGFGYDLEGSKEFMKRFRDILNRIHEEVFAVMVGIETDTDTMILHGEDGKTVLSQMDDKSENGLRIMVKRLYSKMPARMVEDFIPILSGNIAHVEKTKGKRPTELEHREWVLALGCGFDWLQRPNTALIVGPRDPNVRDPILVAARIIKSNIDAGRVRNRYVMLASATYDKPSERLGAIERANHIGTLARRIIRANFPEEFRGMMHRMHVVIDERTMKMERVFEMDHSIRKNRKGKNNSVNSEA